MTPAPTDHCFRRDIESDPATIPTAMGTTNDGCLVLDQAADRTVRLFHELRDRLVRTTQLLLRQTGHLRQRNLDRKRHDPGPKLYDLFR